MLGWLFLPLVFFGVDESLDPARFALLPLRRRTLIAGLLTAALIGVPAGRDAAGHARAGHRRRIAAAARVAASWRSCSAWCSGCCCAWR